MDYPITNISNNRINNTANTVNTDKLDANKQLILTLKKDIIKTMLKRNITLTVKTFMLLLKCTTFEYTWNHVWYMYMKFVGIQHNPKLFIWLCHQFKYYTYFQKK